MANLNYFAANQSYILGKVSSPQEGQALPGLASWLEEPLESRFGSEPNNLNLPPLSAESQQALYNLGLDNWSNTLNLDLVEK